MKKLLLIIIFVFIFSMVIVKSSDDYSYLLDDETYNLYTVRVDNLNTKNIFDFFSDIDIVRIYPKVNSLYKNNIGNVSYKFRGLGLENDIDIFCDYYLSLIKKNSYNDYNYLYINGIDIEKLEIYIKANDLYNFLVKNGAHLLGRK